MANNNSVYNILELWIFLAAYESIDVIELSKISDHTIYNSSIKQKNYYEDEYLLQLP